MSILSRVIFLSALSITLISCSSSTESQVNNEGNISNKSGVATLSWSAPDKNNDGSTLNDLTEYKIHYGEQVNNLNESVKINDINITSYVIENLNSNTTYYFSITAVNNQNTESAYSNIVSKTIN